MLTRSQITSAAGCARTSLGRCAPKSVPIPRRPGDRRALLQALHERVELVGDKSDLARPMNVDARRMLRVLGMHRAAEGADRPVMRWYTTASINNTITNATSTTSRAWEKLRVASVNVAETVAPA